MGRPDFSFSPAVLSSLVAYQSWVRKTALYPPGLNYPLSTLASEAGEALGTLCKCVRRSGELAVQFADLESDLQTHIRLELSDVLWGLAAALNECGMTFDELAALNRRKLEEREAAGTHYSSVPR